ncbi:hypothetical protein G6011_06709 [Alternaria panax]|uniref:Heterokaryon incompatibility domain-containing protein n=1 Tax=Alternaria panax TaxID=48097 RepID=A0AAD4FJX4_9PLEO|nr:hypothetical protein G6011_06709 [Alternaria panax]
MSTDQNALAVPHQLCQYCENVAIRLRAALKTCFDYSEELQIEHYPNMQTFAESMLQQQCHLCMIFRSQTVYTSGLYTTEEFLLMLNEYRDKADRPLHLKVKSGDKSGSSPEVFDLSLGYNIDGLTFDKIARARLIHCKGGAANKDVTPELLSIFTASESSYANIKRWLHICTTEHVDCRRNPRRRAPTRLLDLGIQSTEGIRLIAGTTIGQAPYAALSYIWGSVPQLALTPENYSEFKTQILMESLSKVAQDAVTVCRMLSVRYLWIDAICIIQGPKGDFQQEAALMEDVYANALLTINAADVYATQPFLVRRNPLRWIDCRLMADDDGECQSYVSGNPFCDAGHNLPGTFPLDSRGWCFQEQFLSPRSIYFSKEGVHWECRKSVVCERHQDMRAENHQNMLDRPRKTLYKNLVSMGDDLSDPATTLELREIWKRILQRYSATRLTHPSDKMAALAGIASMFESKFNMRASFGLWLELLLDELL